MGHVVRVETLEGACMCIPTQAQAGAARILEVASQLDPEKALPLWTEFQFQQQLFQLRLNAPFSSAPAHVPHIEIQTELGGLGNAEGAGVGVHSDGSSPVRRRQAPRERPQTVRSERPRQGIIGNVGHVAAREHADHQRQEHHKRKRNPSRKYELEHSQFRHGHGLNVFHSDLAAQRRDEMRQAALLCVAPSSAVESQG